MRATYPVAPRFFRRSFLASLAGSLAIPAGLRAQQPQQPWVLLLINVRLFDGVDTRLRNGSLLIGEKIADVAAGPIQPPAVRV